MCTVRFVCVSLSDDLRFPNGLRYPAFMLTSAFITRTLILLLGLVLFVWIPIDESQAIAIARNSGSGRLALQRILCVNCNICVNATNTQNRFLVLEQNTRIASLISNWISPVMITDEDYICEACFNLAMQAVNDELCGDYDRCAGPSRRGHTEVCLLCGRSLVNKQCHFIQSISHISEIINTIKNRIAPRQISPSDSLCHACFMHVKRHAIYYRDQEQRNVDDANVESQVGDDQLAVAGHSAHGNVEQGADDNQQIEEGQLADAGPAANFDSDESHVGADQLAEQDHGEALENLVEVVHPEAQQDPHERLRQPQTLLLNYKRAPNTASHCIFYGCENVLNLRTVSNPLRRTLLVNYKYYVPIHARICSTNLIQNNWDVLYDADNSMSNFTVAQIEHMLSFLHTKQKAFLDFSSMASLQQIDDHLFGYWMGMTKDNFIGLLQELPRILESKRGILGLASILIKMRTVDSNVRISKLLNIPRQTLERLTSNVREKLLQDFVPRYLGLNHKSREELLQHNLSIPNSIFNENLNQSIIICDGTYIYLNKSSHYMFQKESYSLHKYKNLLKPFMLVTCDGYILDCFGPYKATTSDADIMKSLFIDENSSLRQYFQENDIFILDRGFRDSISLLENCNYKAYMPDSLHPGEHQLTTTQANRSRCITLCRWVVEAVNGYFKRDYRLFRFDHFNKTVPYMMAYFQIAAALINKFGVRLRDRVDADQIINVIRERMPLENNLSRAVNALNLNRRVSFFRRITDDGTNIMFPCLEYDELILFALGTYQIRQARSYYGEHVRFHGGYRIEVCREILDLSQFNLGSGVEEYSLIRGKIKSRHIGRRQYYVYIFIQNNLNGRNAIKEYCCNCIVGRRTLGCCSHVMTLVWYLGWGRHQNNIVPPAAFLDDVIIREDIDY